MTTGPDLAKRRTAGWGDQHERDDDLEPTHVIATHLDEDEDGSEFGWLLRQFERFRFFTQNVGSLRDHLRYGRDAAIAIAEKGPWRTANVWFARFTTPFLIVLFFAIWAYFRRLSRFLVATPLTLLIGAWANHVPFLSWFVPDLLDPTTWTWPWSAPVDVCGIDPAEVGTP